VRLELDKETIEELDERQGWPHRWAALPKRREILAVFNLVDL
jgi:hypothetical protein